MDRGHSFVCCKVYRFCLQARRWYRSEGGQSNGAEHTKKGLTYSYMGM
jgi:hypothetical protein